MAEEWVYVMKRERDGKVSWHAFDPIYQLWQTLPPVPVEYSDISEAKGFGCAVLSSCHLFLFGGEDPLRGSMRRVVYYSARTNKWHPAPSMLRRRRCFGCCVIYKYLYVAGGECEEINRALRSAEVYDLNKYRQNSVAEMSCGMVPLIGVAHNGKRYLKGGSNHQVMNEAYDRESNKWSPVNDGMVASWRNPNTTMNDQLHSIDCRDGCKLRVYDDSAETWNKFIDSKLHLGS